MPQIKIAINKGDKKMTVYDVKNVQFVWRGITLTGTGNEFAYNISQQGTSVSPYKGVQGEGLNVVNNTRQWQISRSFKVDSKSLPMLIEDNQNYLTEGIHLYDWNYIEDTLVIRDLNTNREDVFSDCVIAGISGERDAGTRVVTWSALYRNGK